MGQYCTITEQYHEKKCTDIYVLRIIKKVDKEEFANLRECAKNYDGYYSSYRGVNGFVFPTKEDAESFAAILDSYFGALNSDQSITEEPANNIVSKAELSQKTKGERPGIQSLGFGLGWIKEVDVFSKNPPKVETEPKNIPSSLATKVSSRKKVSNTKKHLEFKGIEICGHPEDFENKLMAQGFETEVWGDEFLTMKGKFAGVPNCKIRIHFYAGENIVYKVSVEFQWYQDRRRVANDYKKLKKSLQELYGKPKCDNEDSPHTWVSTYTIPKGIITLMGFPANIPNVCIDYYDGYYDKHHGKIDHDTAILDL